MKSSAVDTFAAFACGIFCALVAVGAGDRLHKAYLAPPHEAPRYLDTGRCLAERAPMFGDRNEIPQTRRASCATVG